LFNVYNYNISYIIIRYDSIPLPFIERSNFLRNYRPSESSTYLTFTREYVFSSVLNDSLFSDVNLEEFFRIERNGGHNFNTSEDVSYTSRSDLRSEQHIIYKESELYSVSTADLNAHFVEADYPNDVVGYNAAKQQLTSASSCDSIYSFNQSSTIEIERLSQNSNISVMKWITMNLPGNDEVWGERSDSITNRSSSFLRASTLEKSLSSSEIRIPISQDRPNLQYLVDNWDNWFGPSSQVRDTLGYNKDIFLYVHPDSSRAEVELNRGYIFMIPVAGKLACSLYVNRTPSLEEFAWASVDAALIASPLWWRPISATRQANTVFINVVNASTQTPNSSAVVERASTQVLQRTLEVAGRSSGPGQIHHMVAFSAARANVSRQILEKFGIGIDDAVNLVPLPSHLGAHSAAYYSEVERRLVGAASKLDVIEALNVLRDDLIRGVVNL
jgi:hypothetical protein